MKYPKLFEEPPEDEPPPWPARILLFLTCTGVSFAHASNDGQKGMGVVMLILVGVLPAIYAVDLGLNGQAVEEIRKGNRAVSTLLIERNHASIAPPATKPGVPITKVPNAASLSAEVKASNRADKDEAIINDYIKSGGRLGPTTFKAMAAKNDTIAAILANKTSLDALPKADRATLRTDSYLVSSALEEMSKKKTFDGSDLPVVAAYRKSLDSLTKFFRYGSRSRPPWRSASIRWSRGSES